MNLLNMGVGISRMSGFCGDVQKVSEASQR